MRDDPYTEVARLREELKRTQDAARQGREDFIDGLTVIAHTTALTIAEVDRTPLEDRSSDSSQTFFETAAEMVAQDVSASASDQACRIREGIVQQVKDIQQSDLVDGSL